MVQKEKRVATPLVNVNHNDSNTGLVITVDLAGASKDSVDLEVGDKGFCVKAEAEDRKYENCFMLGHEIRRNEAKAKFDSGMLRITVPFKDVVHGHKVTIQ